MTEFLRQIVKTFYSNSMNYAILVPTNVSDFKWTLIDGQFPSICVTNISNNVKYRNSVKFSVKYRNTVIFRSNTGTGIVKYCNTKRLNIVIRYTLIPKAPTRQIGKFRGAVPESFQEKNLSKCLFLVILP